MKTSSFLTALRSHDALPLVFRSGHDRVPAGYHLTEVKRVAYETMDCGAMTHRWAESQFEVWVPAGADAAAVRGHMPAGKFLRIVDRVEAELPLDRDAPARIHASFGGGPAALYDVAAVEPVDGELVVELAADRARCKAAERRAASAVNSSACCGEKAEPEPAAAGGCGCTPTPEGRASVVCCA